MKKLTAILSTSIIAATLFTSSALAAELKMNVNGNAVDFKYGSPFIENGSSLIPLRDLLISLGVPNNDQSIIWNGTDQSVTAIKGETTIKLAVGQKEIYKNGKLFRSLEVPAKNVDGRVFLPARAVAEALGNKVGYDSTTSTVLIDSSAASNTTTFDPSDLSEIISSGTNNTVRLPAASLSLLEANKELFFAPNRDMISLKGKTSVVTDVEIKKNVTKYNNTIAEKMDITIDLIKEYTGSSGETITEAIGHTGGKIDYLSEKWRDATYYQVFFVGTNNVKKGDVTYVNGVPVGQTTVNLENFLGVQFEAPMYVLVAGNFYSVADAVDNLKESTSITEINGEKVPAVNEQALRNLNVYLNNVKSEIKFVSTVVNSLQVYSIEIDGYIYKPAQPLEVIESSSQEFNLNLLKNSSGKSFLPTKDELYTVKLQTSIGDISKSVTYLDFGGKPKTAPGLDVPVEKPYTPGQGNKQDEIKTPAKPIEGDPIHG
ncbi:copper amine oxidase N-terminal domain-containing protein [Paenibacillus sp. N3.4]|uniref:copper amine oxidase N-terminal domain-containing protein n=1 Tax=Paenibacillus sp. N3.4 TaxID=2603222 RepID=UPI0011C9901A|nr:copper amine oxidase N-terminal domain-containing protein [Paenibacillus sp. N3.4]TXK75429.1 copper amine oxidase N-terminal domain-containing protein [Paenibacillus sp. N3.4]